MTWPVDVQASDALSPGGGVPIACGAVLWRHRGQLHVTAIAKATFDLSADGALSPAAPDDIRRAEIHHQGNPGRSIRETSDLAPLLARADVVLTGHACAPPGQFVQSCQVRLAVGRGEQTLVDRTLDVHGDEGPAGIKPFHQIALVYEHAYGGIGWLDNPLGRGAGASAGRAPNVFDNDSPDQPGCFGPIGRAWPRRKSLLRGLNPAALRGAILDLPEDLDWSYFQTAPPSQQIDGPLHGEEWILLQGLHPAQPRVLARLPGARAIGRVLGLAGPGGPPDAPLTLHADTLRIDTDALRCSVTWRGSIAVPGEDALAALRILVAVETDAPARAQAVRTSPSASSEGRDDDPARAAALRPDEDGSQITHRIEDERRPAARPALDETLAITDPGAGAQAHGPALPFQPAPPGAAPPPPTHDRAPGPPALPFTTPTIVPLDELPTLHPPAAAHAPPAAEPQAARWFHTPAAGAGAGAAPRPDAAATPVVPPRTTEAIPIVHRTSLAVVTIPWAVRPPRDSLTVIVKGTFDIVPGAPARLRPESEPPTGDLYFDDDATQSVRYPSDYAIFKPQADVVLTGHAYAPGASTTAAQVRFRFGRGKNAFDRRIAVFGERSWPRGRALASPPPPAKFTRVPLRYEHAFGGAGHDENPLGAGFTANRAGASPHASTRLPALEDPSRLITTPGDVRQPACFAPIPPLWKERWSRLGTYDDRWLKARWPYFPEDFDWSHYQAAPAAQRVDHLAGDEPFDLAGVHPTFPRIQGSLPGLRVRCFAQRAPEAGGGFHEISLHLDTVVLDADDMKMSLVWRGLLEVSDEDAPEIQALFVLQEPLDAPPASLAQAREQMLRVLLPLSPAEADPGAPAPAAANEDAPAGDDDKEPQLVEIEAQVARAQQERAERLRAAGIPEEAIGAAGPTAPPTTDPAQILAALAAAGARPEDVEELRKVLEPEPPAPPELTARERVVALHAAGEPLDGLDLQGADLSDLDLAGASFVNANLKDARLDRAKLQGANLSGAQLGGASLEEAALDRARLEHADLHGARVAKATFDGATLDGASFIQARGEGASFQGARGERAVFSEGSWTGARFDEAELASADFMAARLDGAHFTGAKLPAALLFGAQGEGARFDRAVMTGAGAEGAAFPGGSFLEIDAAGSTWEGAALGRATMLRASLRGASFIRASCAEAIFSGADLRDACFRRAKLAGASFIKADLMQASLERADLTGADLRGASLHACETWKAKLSGARLDQAIVTRTKLAGRT